MTQTTRISITVSEDDLRQWQFINPRESLSAFVREAVNQYVDELTERRSKKQKIEKKIKKNTQRIEKIEEDLLEIQAALAKQDIVPELDTDQQRILNFIEQRLNRADLSLEDRQMFAKIRQQIK